jgi:large subunit ribosomal protein L19e
MKLDNKKNLAARTLNVGKERIVFDENRLAEIKEAITKQDIFDLIEEKAIKIKLKKGKRKIVKKKTRRRQGKIKKVVQTRKQDYARRVRKLRSYLKKLKDTGKVDAEKYKTIRNKIRQSKIKDLKEMKEELK